MSLADLYSKLLELAPSEYKDIDYIDHIASLFERYIAIVSGFAPEPSIQDKFNARLPEIEGYCNSIVRAVDLYYKGQYSQSFIEVKRCLDKLPSWKVAHKLPGYRMRVLDEGCMPTFEGMFHIPFNRRGIVSTQRYSSPGQPCLYLGLSPYACWEEMGRPTLEKTYVSRFQPKYYFMYLPFCIPFLEAWNNQEMANKKFLDDLLYFPFVMVSMVKVNKNNKNFKPEYIIPQMVMQWLLESRSVDDDPTKKPIGVLYTSVHYNKDLNSKAWSLFENIAIPCFFDGEKIYSEKISNWFSYTDPVRCDLEHVKLKDLTDEDKMIALGDIMKDENNYPIKSIKD